VRPDWDYFCLFYIGHLKRIYKEPNIFGLFFHLKSYVSNWRKKKNFVFIFTIGKLCRPLANFWTKHQVIVAPGLTVGIYQTHQFYQYSALERKILISLMTIWYTYFLVVCFILWQFGMNVLWSFAIFPPFLVYCIKKNLASLPETWPWSFFEIGPQDQPIPGSSHKQGSAAAAAGCVNFGWARGPLLTSPLAPRVP
jgi:hypothetical protein